MIAGSGAFTLRLQLQRRYIYTHMHIELYVHTYIYVQGPPDAAATDGVRGKAAYEPCEVCRCFSFGACEWEPPTGLLHGLIAMVCW